MMIRILSVLALFVTISAQAGDYPCYGKDCDVPCRGKNCDMPAPHPVPPPHHPSPAPRGGFCDGTFEGGLYSQPGALTLEIRQIDDFGTVEVAGWWNGNQWFGRGVCQQFSECQAGLTFQFPNTPVQRGVISVDQRGAAVLDGRVDFGDGFRLFRRSW